jgi:hypothetical protein
MHFDSFSLGVRHLFQKLVFFLCEVILVMHCCFQNKNLYQNYYKKICIPIWKKYFDSLALKPLVNLVGRFVAYSQ